MSQSATIKPKRKYIRLIVILFLGLLIYKCTSDIDKNPFKIKGYFEKGDAKVLTYYYDPASVTEFQIRQYGSTRREHFRTGVTALFFFDNKANVIDTTGYKDFSAAFGAAFDSHWTYKYRIHPTGLELFEKNKN